MKFISDINKLFLKKEGQELLGSYSSNFIALTTILVFTILSIAFADSSRSYLEARMADPFVNCVDIFTEQPNNTNGIESPPLSLIDFIESKDIQDSCAFTNPIPTYTQSIYFFTPNKDKFLQFEGRSFDVNAGIFKQILSTKNVLVRRKDSIDNDKFGIIVTRDLIKRLGYPANFFPDHLYIAQYPKLYDDSLMQDYNPIRGAIPVAIPVFAVVKEVPGVEYSFLFTEEFNNVRGDEQVWDVVNHKRYNTTLNLYGAYDAIENIRLSLLQKYSNLIYVEEYQQDLSSWNENMAYLVISQIGLDDDEKTAFFNNMYFTIRDTYSDIERIYHFESIKDIRDEIPMYSIEIKDLKTIRTLQSAIKNLCGIRLDMRSIESLDNFYYVEMMSMVLSWSIVTISVIFIFVFIYFMLYTHFQKIQKNLGTFKAFGFSNKKLCGIYIVLISVIVMTAFTISMVILAIIQFMLHLFNVGMVYSDTTYPIFDVFTIHTIYLFIIILFATITSTCIVTYLKFRHTPGDLIYNRNQQ